MNNAINFICNNWNTITLSCIITAFVLAFLLIAYLISLNWKKIKRYEEKTRFSEINLYQFFNPFVLLNNKNVYYMLFTEIFLGMISIAVMLHQGHTEIIRLFDLVNPSDGISQILTGVFNLLVTMLFIFAMTPFMRAMVGFVVLLATFLFGIILIPILRVVGHVILHIILFISKSFTSAFRKSPLSPPTNRH